MSEPGSRLAGMRKVVSETSERMVMMTVVARAL